MVDFRNCSEKTFKELAFDSMKIDILCNKVEGILNSYDKNTIIYLHQYVNRVNSNHNDILINNYDKLFETINDKMSIIIKIIDRYYLTVTGGIDILPEQSYQNSRKYLDVSKNETTYDYYEFISKKLEIIRNINLLFKTFITTKICYDESEFLISF